MALIKNALLIGVLAFAGHSVRANELATAGQSANLRQVTGGPVMLKAGDIVWVRNKDGLLCEKLLTTGVQILKRAVALSKDGCAGHYPLRDYTEVLNAYTKYDDTAAISNGNVPTCASLTLNKVPVSTMCTTQRGKVFKLLKRDAAGVIWEDLATRKMWGDMLSPNYRLHQALKACADYSRREAKGKLANVTFTLPSADDFQTAQNDGFLEVVPHFAGHSFWTSTEQSDNPNAAYIYDVHRDYNIGFDNGVDGGKGFEQDIALVRCMGR